MNEIELKLESVLPKIARRFQNELLLTCPVDTGRLRNSIKVKLEGKSLIVWMVDYGAFVEFGTSRQRPNPFIRNVINNKLKSIIIEELSK